MANIKLTDNYWETSGVYDKDQSKTQRQINADVQTALAGKVSTNQGVSNAGKVLLVGLDGNIELKNIQHTITVTCETQDGVTVTGQTVTLREGGPNGTVFGTAAYEGQPVSFAANIGFTYYVEVTDNLAHHFNPTKATGAVMDTDVFVTLVYTDLSSIKTAPDIKAALDASFDLTSLVGEQVTCTRNGQTLTWDVADYSDNTITLLLHDTLPTQLVFEPAQALAWFENGLAAGDYKFKHGNAYYYFTLTKAIPEEGQLRATTSAFTVYESQDSTATYESGTVSTTEIADAVELGTTASNAGTYALNHMDRVTYGSNNYKESGLRQWLNSDALSGTPMPRINKFSRPCVYGDHGFMYNLDPEFVAVLDDTVWKCSTNNVYEAPASVGGTTTKSTTYTLTEKFGLASEMEIFSSYGGTTDGSTVFSLFNGATANDRKKYYNNSARYWWLRSPHWGNAYNERNVYANGNAYYYNATSSYGVVPACKISKSV